MLPSINHPAGRRTTPTSLARLTRRPCMAALLAGPALLLALALAAPPASAHAERPASTTTVEAGAYPLTVALYADPPRAGQEFAVVVTPAPGSVAPDAVRLVARPGLGTNATPTRALLTPDPDAPGSFAGTAHLPVVGPWLLDVLVDGPAGPATATVPVTAGAPGAVPIWLGWALGLAPLLGLAWFVGWQHRYLRRLEAASGVA
jgi:hypothetical protein